MNYKKLLFCLSLLIAVTGTSSSHAATPPKGNSTDSELLSERPESGPHGMMFTLLGDPGINVFGINYLYNLDQSFRLHGGFGTMFDFGWTVGAGADYRIPTGSRFRPLFGLGLNYIKYSYQQLAFSSSGPNDFSIFSTEHTESLVYSDMSAGVEYQAPTGFLVSLHVRGICGRLVSNRSNVECAFTPIPALRIGTMF